MKRDEVWALCSAIAPAYGFEPVLVLALCEQESVNPKDPLDYRHGAVRLENGFEVRYTDPLDYAETTEVLLATSWGLTQMMGLSLKEVGYFDWWFSSQTSVMQSFLSDAMSEIAVPKALNEYLTNPKWQVERGCMWLKKKSEVAHGEQVRMLRLWNGDVTGAKHYAEDVLARQKKLSIIYEGM